MSRVKFQVFCRTRNIYVCMRSISQNSKDANIYVFFAYLDAYQSTKKFHWAYGQNLKKG